MPDNLQVAGTFIEVAELRIPRALALARFLHGQNAVYASLAACIKFPGGEIVVWDVEPQLPQRLKHDIRQAERLAAMFAESDSSFPEVLALRWDFPSVPHLNLRWWAWPRSLCLYDRDWSEVKREWTAAKFVEELRQWLSKTSVGRLHAADQPLEAIIMAGRDELVLPSRFFDENLHAGEPLFVYGIRDSAGRATFIAEERPRSDHAGLRCLAVPILCPPQQHGTISNAPEHLGALNRLLSAAGLDLLGFLRTELRRWRTERQSLQHELSDRLILIVYLPKTRTTGGEVETVEVRAFATSKTIAELGEDIGVWCVTDGQVGLLLEMDESKVGATTYLDTLSARPSLSRKLAALMNGGAGERREKVVAIGAGAIGSQVITNLIRAGFGLWTVVDEDRLMPHNVARHVLWRDAVGYSKADVISHLGNLILDEPNVCSPLVANVMDPGENRPELTRLLKSADIVLDMSASISVARELALNADSKARRLSVFLNAAGDSVVLLLEDAGRKYRLDSLEMQLYRAVVHDPKLETYLATPGGTIRPGQSCREVTSQIAQSQVSTLCGIAAEAIRRFTSSPDAAILIWRQQEASLAIEAISILPASPTVARRGRWTVIWDGGLLEHLGEWRKRRLPNETGGILLGHFDMSRQILYVVDMLPSPPDSAEWPTAYIRGWKGLGRELTKVHTRTAGMLNYVGEWHSHPDGYGVSPSNNDRGVLKWVAEYQAKDGLPGLISIAGEDNAVAFYLRDES
jgi:hypothetical protein